MNGTTQSFAGYLLIAMPNLADPNFWQSVVLLGVHSDDEGAFGLVINRTLDVDLREVLQELGEEPVSGDLPGVFGGGPVQPSKGLCFSNADSTRLPMTKSPSRTQSLFPAVPRL